MQGCIMFGILVFINTAMYVMIQMYFEGHEAFKCFDEAFTNL